MNNIYGSMLANLDKLTEDMNKLTESIASGKKYSMPSDDPIGLINALETRSIIAEIDQYERNITHGASWMDGTELALRQTDEVITRSRELAVQMASGTQNEATRASAATEVDELIEQVVALGNTRLGEKYVFAGQKTDTTPFSYDGATVTYNGDENDINLRIGRDNNMVINKTGVDAFMDGDETTNLFSYLIDLKTALENNSTSEIQDSLGNLNAASDYISEKVSACGAKQNRLQVKKYMYGELRLSNTEKLSDTEDTDLAEAMLTLKTREYAYQAALLAASKVMQMNLADFIR
ncbi:MAG: flagellar hook-associated protein FlgL [Pseudomonadota bacterium]